MWWLDERAVVVAPSGQTVGAMLAWWPRSKLRSTPSARYAWETEQLWASGYGCPSGRPDASLALKEKTWAGLARFVK